CFSGRELGLIRKRTLSSSSHAHTLSASNQLFSYLIIIDFESTCWREKTNHGQEIIEFPAVLMNTHTGQIESEFHSYVQPQEHPVLSSFCTELTGITQEQVEAGLPLQICLSRFTRWVQTLQQERGVVFLRDHTQTHTAVSGKHCAFLTWSDWDLGVCLQYECKRKQISKPEVLNSWIDLRATYRMFYHRKPKGLNGALQDLGIEFSGREHSGLDDARNTARLAWRMIRDGCMMKITKSVSRAPLKSGAPVRGVCADGRVCNERKEKRPTHTGDTHTGLHTVTSSRTSVCQSLVPLRTVLSSITTPLHTLSVTHASRPDTSVTHASRPDTSVTHASRPETSVTHASRSDTPVTHASRPDTPVTHASRPDTPVTHASRPDTPVTHASRPDTPVTHASRPETPVTHASRPETPVTHASRPDTLVSDWPEEFVLTEFGESGSYDDVVLEDISGNMPQDSASPMCKTKPRPLNPNPPCSFKDPIRSLKGLGTRTPTIPFSIYNDQSHQSSSSSSSSVFRVPSSVLSLTLNQSARPSVSINQSARPSVSINQSARPSVSINQSACSSIPINQSKLSSVSVNQSLDSISLNQSALSYISVNQPAHSSFSSNRTRPSCSVNQSSLSSSSKQLPLPPPRGRAKDTSSFTNKSVLSSFSLNQSAVSSVCINQSGLSLLSANQSAFSTSSSKRLPLPPLRGGVKITSPLCDCGRRSRRLTVCNGGPNHGRAFYTCAGRRSSGPAPRYSTHTGSASRNNGCGFFKWESALIKSSAVSGNTSALSFNLRTAASRNFR
ncbi:ERI1 exoribonuclease 2, partial [Pangasianodon hypophthalmus]|uniref:ERI1 exoribonuclease 2 n=1 Tax=Pangasianodon hypophthalmus TaxID=310915 RepID=UPI0023077933